MNKTFLLSLLLGLLASTTNAQSIDAKDYFDGKPYGWATCADEAGTPYELKGGMAVAKPKTIILQTNGADNSAAIIEAIANYDIIVFDGSKGDFKISSQMAIANAKHKTIVGKNNARLCTAFVLTADIRAKLKSYNLSNLSSTKQVSGTLPDGSVIASMDERAFYTRKALQEIAYAQNGNYDIKYMTGSGIFGLQSSDEDIIIRNITFVGPGSIDIDGVDLITNLESNHVWVDHCTFIDGLDGSLDSKRNDYASYTWNHFYYTENSFSHAYTTACGWVDNHSMTQHLTFANNIWGAGCSRRLPQAADCYIHLLNNFHNCPGNSLGMTLNGYMKALVEGNYAASGVNSPLCGSADSSDPSRAHHKIYAVDNSFSQSSVEASCRNNAEITVPYEYKKVSFGEVKNILTGTHGAGATLEYFMPGDVQTLSADNFGFYESALSALVGNKTYASIKNLLGASYTITSSNEAVATVNAEGVITPKAEGTTTITITADDALYGTLTQSITLSVTAPSDYGTVYLWDFNSRSEETTALLDKSDWSCSGTNYTCDVARNKEPLIAADQEIKEAKGLLFTFPANQFVYYANSIRFNKPSAIIIPNLKKDDKVSVTWKSANSSSERGFTTSNLANSSLTTISKKTAETNVLADGDVILSTNGGIYTYGIEVKRQGSGTTAIKNINEQIGKEACVYNLAGQKVSANYKGIVIKNGRKVQVR